MNTIAQTPTKAHAWGVAVACLLLAGALVTNTQAHEWNTNPLDITPNSQIAMIPPNWKSSEQTWSKDDSSSKSICESLPPTNELLALPLTMQQAQCIVERANTLGIPETTSDTTYTWIRKNIAPYLSTIESKKRLSIALNDQEKLLLRAVATLSLG